MKIAFAGLRHNHIYRLAEMIHCRSDVEIIGYWEEDETISKAAEGRLEAPAYKSYDDLLNDKSVDVVAVGDYYGIRGSRIIQALRAGKHVLSDKPICTSLTELTEIQNCCHEYNLKIGCMLDLRYDPALRLARQLIQDNELGEIHAVSFNGQHPLSWGSRPMWYFEEGKHGGTLNDIAIHGLDAIDMITGIPYACTLHARQWNAYAKQCLTFCDCAQFIGELENGAGVIADVSYSAPNLSAFALPSYWRFSFWGESGWLECRVGEGNVVVALANDRYPRQIAANVVNEDYLSDLMREIRGEHTLFDTESVLSSTRRALNLQAVADQMRKDEIS